MVIAGIPLTFRFDRGIECVSVLFREGIYTDSVSREKATGSIEMDQTGGRGGGRSNLVPRGPWQRAQQ